MAKERKVTRREFLKVSTVVVTGGMLAACSPAISQPQQQATDEQVAASETVTIHFPHAMGDDGQPVFEDVATKFQEKNPNVTVLVDPTFDWDAQKYLVQAAAGTAPDVLWGDEHFVYNFSSKGVLLDLNPFMEQSGFNKDDFDDLFQYFAFQGAQYGIALWSGSYALFYNKKLLDEAGVGYPTDEWTYDDLLAATQATTKDTNGDGEPDIWGFHCQTGWANPWGSTIWAFGGEYFNEDGTHFLLCEPPNYAGLQWYLDLIHKHKVAPLPEIADAIAGGGDPFTLGVVGLKGGSPWSMPTYRKITEFEWEVAPMPIGPQGRYAALTTDSLSIYEGSKAPDVAWSFIEELLSEDSAKVYCSQFKGPVPALKAGHQYFILPDELPSNQQVFVDAVSYAKVPFQSPYSYVVEEPFYQALSAATNGTSTLDEAMAGVCDAINTALEEEVQSA
jgi:multiple sugar transport system substrate-binding protein